MRFLRRLTLLALLAGLFAWLRKVLSEDVLERTASPSTGGVPAPEPEPRPAPEPAGGPAASGSSSGEPTKAELYERAQQLGIEGRSKMSKAELARAISQAD